MYYSHQMKQIQLIGFLWLATVSILYSQQMAFPTAEGYGRYAKGARAAGLRSEFGMVVQVTNLDDDLENPPVGSFRWAVKQGIEDIEVNGNVIKDFQRPLYVVFRVGGVIDLKGELRVERDYMTIAGETALGDGICFKGGTLNFGGSNHLIVRYIRSRPGDELGEETSAFRIENGSNFIIDHCSFSWGIEETTHFSSSPDFTIQWCIISEGLYNSFHKKGPRGYGAQWGGEYSTYHHNLMAHHNSRTPRINGSNENDVEALVDYRNNVNYNWGRSGSLYGGEWMKTNGRGFAHTNMVNNYFIPGPGNYGTLYFAAPGMGDNGYSGWYINGNVMVGQDTYNADNWQGVDVSSVGIAANIKSEVEFVQTDGVLEAHDSYTESAVQAFQSVMNKVGDILPKRDTIDARIIAEAKGDIPVLRYTYVDTADKESPIKGLGSGIIDTQWNLVSQEDRESGLTAWDVYEAVSADEAQPDRDMDGMPDAWEEANGLNPDNYNDFKTITESGYSNLELYLFSLTGDDVVLSKPSKLYRNDLSLFPNPCGDYLVLRKSFGEITANYEVIDLLGHLCLAGEIAGEETIINTAALNAGYFILKVHEGQNVTLGSFFKR